MPEDEIPERKFPQILNKPDFGIVPARYTGNYKEMRPFEYEEILEMVRERPGEDAKIAVFTDGGRKATLAQCHAARARVWRWLLDNRPLEDWKVMTRLTPGTWGDRELWVTYLGLMTPEEAVKMSDLRKDAFSHKLKRGLTPQENRENRFRSRQIWADAQAQRKKQIREQGME